MSEDVVLYEERDTLALVTINRPERMNTLNEAVIQGIADAVDRAAASEAVRAVILRGAGRTFTAGYDLNPGPGGGRFAPPRYAAPSPPAEARRVPSGRAPMAQITISGRYCRISRMVLARTPAISGWFSRIRNSSRRARG